MENVNLNLDAKTLEQCLKTVNDFGHSTLINICTGQENIIPWGTVDWTLAIFLILLGLGVIGIFIGMLIMAINS